MTRRQPRQRRLGGSLTAHVGDFTIRASNPRQMVELLEKQADEADTSIAREMFLQHAEHYRKDV